MPNAAKLFLVLCLLSCSSLANSNGEGVAGCLSGELVTRSFISSLGAVRTFSYSKDCLLQGGDPFARSEESGSRLMVEAYFPGFISRGEVDRLQKSSRDEYVRFRLMLGFGPTPLMISSAIDRRVAREKLVEDRDNYRFYEIESTMEERGPSIFIVHNKRSDFHVTCFRSVSCSIQGIHIDHKIHYRMTFYSIDRYRNWEKIHDQVLNFIDSALQE